MNKKMFAAILIALVLTVGVAFGVAAANQWLPWQGCTPNGSPGQGCWVNDCTTWLLGPVSVVPDSSGATVTFTATVGNIPSGPKAGQIVVGINGQFNEPTQTDATSDTVDPAMLFTGQVLDNKSPITGTYAYSQHFNLPAGTYKFVVYFGQEGCANCAQMTDVTVNITQKTHKVTWDVTNDCTGWSATYAIDDSSPVSYASGTWIKPYVLESANVPAEDIPTVSGQTYDNPHKDVFTVNEPETCLVTINHNHSLTPASDCITGWSVTPTSSDGGVFTPKGALSGTWKDQYDPESATVNGTWNWTDGYSVSDSITINKDASCIVNLNHNAVINATPDCNGWSASFSSSDGGIGTPTTPTSGTWTDPYSLEHATVSYHVVWTDGYSTDISKTVDKPDSCLHTKTSVTITPGPCKYQKGQDFSLVLGDGLTFKVFKKGANPATDTPVVSMTASGKFHLPKGSSFWVATAAQGYDIVGPDSGNIKVNDNCNAPPPPPTQKIGLAMLYCTDGSRCYDQGKDGVCWIKYSLAPGQMFSTANAVKYCDLGPGVTYNPDIMKVYVDPVTNRSFMEEVFLGYPYTKMCWGPDNKGNCVLDQLLAVFNKAHGTHYMYGWLFPGFGGH
jgi:hypothetical protein